MKIPLHHPHRKLPLTAAVVIDSLSLYIDMYETSKGKTRKAAKKRGGGVSKKRRQTKTSVIGERKSVYISDL